MSEPSTGTPVLRLARCDLQTCEAACCYDGAYLEPGEEEAILALIARHPDRFAFLRGPAVVDGNWRGLVEGRKTSVVPHRYRGPSFPAHFEHTRCALALSDGRCSLQVVAEDEGVHPWTWKPRACWMHPLGEGPDGPLPPPTDPRQDPQRVDDDYPGYVTFTPCGQHRPDGAPWHDVLVDEIAYGKKHPRR